MGVPPTSSNRGFVTYSNEAKSDLLGVPPDIVAERGAVSAETAAAITRGTLAHARVGLALSVVGITVPGRAHPTKPVGLVLFGLARRVGECRTEGRVFPGDSTAVRQAAVNGAPATRYGDATLGHHTHEALVHFALMVEDALPILSVDQTRLGFSGSQ